MISIGIVGLPNVGKSTLFNAITKKKVPAENFPFCTIDPSVGTVYVPDVRLDKLSEFSKSKKTIPPATSFVDIAGLVEGAASGEGLGNKFLSHIKETNAIAEVVRIFEDSNIRHVRNEIDPIKDIEVIGLEFVLADLETVSKRIDSVVKEIKKGDKEAKILNDALEKLRPVLEEGRVAKEIEFSKEELIEVKKLNLLTMKPILYVLNKKTEGRNLDEMGDIRYENLIKYFKKCNYNWVVIDANIEQELGELDDEDKDEYRKELGVSDDGVNNLIKECYKMLDLITFFTTGEDETRGWTIKRNVTAPTAGTAIHSDFHDKFIKADVIFWKDLIDSGTFANAREKGAVRTEGKNYVVCDGDVIEFKI